MVNSDGVAEWLGVVGNLISLEDEYKEDYWNSLSLLSWKTSPLDDYISDYLPDEII